MSLLDAMLLDPPRLNVWIALRSDGVAGTGTQTDPFDGSTLAKFDALMNGVVENTCVHLGPGTFETAGYYEGIAGSWQLKKGMKVVGSGMAVTTLQLVKAIGRRKYFSVIGVRGVGYSAPLLESFEAEELCIDCNIANQPSQSLTCAAIFVRGNNTLYRRIRAINFGRQGIGINPLDSLEPFVLAAGGPDYSVLKPQDASPFNGVIEECVVEQPGLNSVKETTCLMFIGGSSNLSTSLNVQTFPRAATIRNCEVNCEFQDKPIQISSISLTGTPPTSATVTTKTAHGLTGGSWVRISGVRVSTVVSGGLDQFDNSFNGSYQITYINATQFSYVPNPALSGAAAPLATSEMWVGRWPSTFVRIMGIDTRTGGAGNWNLDVTTQTSHYLVPGNTAVLTGVNAALLNGKWEVTSVTDRKKFSCKATTANPGTFSGTAILGVNFQGMTISGCSAAVAEGNLLLNSTSGGPYPDTGSTQDCVCRNNRYRGVLIGPSLNFQAALSGPMGCTALVNGAAPNDNVATFTVNTDIPHGLSIGQAILVERALVNGTTTNWCKSLTFFNNTDSGGKLIQGATMPNIQQELTTLVDDALMVALL